MKDSLDKKLSTESYKGVRDLYPKDMAIQSYIFDTWSKTAESFGFERYDASILEPSELYRSKGAENAEMVNEQTYTFIDRGEREVTLRPEMTPTVARMVAGKRRELTFPLRWYSIPNLFRYERPQRGRLREHWQLNCDIFGTDSSFADVEIIQLASSILINFGAQQSDFEIKINSRKLWNTLCDSWNLDATTRKELSGLVDRKHKISHEDFREKAQALVLDPKALEGFFSCMEGNVPSSDALSELMGIKETLHELGVLNVQFDPTIMRGFNYYTGIIFEVFDTHSDNRRSLLGGGRYDNLTGLFGGDTITATGFGMGDVTMRDFIETHNLLPQDLQNIDIAVIPLSLDYVKDAEKIAATFRSNGKKVYVSLLDKKIGDHIKQAEKRNTLQIIVVGEQEVQTETFTLKTLSNGSERKGTIAELSK